MSDTVTSSQDRSLAAQLRRVHVGLREDLEVTRHVFRGEPAYVVRDPMTFQSQRLSREDYAIFVSIEASRSLGEIFSEMAAQGVMQADDEESFYQFVLSLHRLGFLRLPVADDRSLYKRYRMRERLRQRETLRSLLFLRVPLWNPDAFLTRTITFVRPFLSRWCVIACLTLMAAAIFVVAQNFSAVMEPLEGVLAAQNLPLIWVTLVVLKVFHEFGHAYACKHFGGHVPEMGAFLILFTPCAYMDASACWGFTRKRERIIVCLAGVYVEAIIASLAVFVWALSESAMIRSVAYNVMFLASVVTILFNINPLMRFDGYYIASDVVEIPNLRQRATAYLVGMLKQWTLGVRASAAETAETGRTRGILAGYGIASVIYRLGLYTAIAAILLIKFYVVGVVLCLVFLGGMVLGLLRRLTAYLWYSPETARIRWRAVAVSLVVLIGVPAGLSFVPAPSFVHAPGVVGAQGETVLRAGESGFLEPDAAGPGLIGDRVEAGRVLYRLANDRLVEAAVHAQAEVAAARLRRDAFQITEPVRALQERAELWFREQVWQVAEARVDSLAVRAPYAGRLVESVRDVGCFIERGAPLGTLVAGEPVVRAVLTEEQYARARPVVGEAVWVRGRGAGPEPVAGVIRRVSPLASRVIAHPALTHEGGGAIVVDPDTRETTRPHFELEIELAGAGQPALRGWTHGMSVVVRLEAAAEPIMGRVARRVVRFWNRLLAG